MSIQLSTGLRQAMLNATGFKTAFANGVIELYTGPQPLNADAAVQGTLLGTITLASGAFVAGVATNGTNFDVPVAGVISKAAAETWSMSAVAIGTAGWFRRKANAVDTGASSTTAVRMDGSIATSGADLNLSNIAMIVGTPVTIDVFQFTLPAS